MNLMQNNWEDVLPNLDADRFQLIYTDPPYGINYKSSIPGHGKWCKNPKNSTKFSTKILNDSPNKVNWEFFAKECYRVLAPNCFLFLHCNIDIIIHQMNFFITAGFDIAGQIAWNKKFSIGGNLTGAMKRDWEPIIYMTKGKAKFRPIKVERHGISEERNRISEIMDWIFPFPKSERLNFPTQKPVALCSQVISLTTNQGDEILDPFTGSGSIPLAAKDLGRKFLAIEADPDAYKIAYNRLFAEKTANG